MSQSVVFDSNIFVADHDLKSALWREFREYRKETKCSVYIPAVVIVELTRKIFQEKHKRALNLPNAANRLRETIEMLRGTAFDVVLDNPNLSLETLAGALSSLSAKLSPEKWRDEVRNHIRQLIGGPFVEEPFPSISHEEMVMRCCVHERKPFPVNGQDKDNDRAYRDTLIWLTVLTLLEKARAGSQLVFVSANVNDFADGNKEKLHPHLLDEAARFLVNGKTINLCKSLEEFISDNVRPLKEELAMREILMRDPAFTDALQREGSRFAAHCFAVAFAKQAALGTVVSDFAIGLISPLVVRAARKLSEDGKDLLIKVDVSARASYMLVTEATRAGKVEALEHTGCVSIASLTYDPDNKIIKETTVEHSYSDHMIDCQFSITTEKSSAGVKSWVVMTLLITNGMPTAGATMGVRFEDWDELQRCLRDLGTPTSDALRQEGTRVFGGDPVPAQVLLKWRLISPQSVPILLPDGSGRFIDATGFGGFASFGGLDYTGTYLPYTAGFGGVVLDGYSEIPGSFGKVTTIFGLKPEEDVINKGTSAKQDSDQAS